MGSRQRKQDPPVVWILGVLCLGARAEWFVVLFFWDNFQGNEPEISEGASRSASHDVSSISAYLN